MENGQDEVQALNAAQKVRSRRSNNKPPGAGMHFSYDMHEPMDRIKMECDGLKAKYPPRLMCSHHRPQLVIKSEKEL